MPSDCVENPVICAGNWGRYGVVAHIGGAHEAVHDATALLDHGDVTYTEDIGEVTARTAPTSTPGPPRSPTRPPPPLRSVATGTRRCR